MIAPLLAETAPPHLSTVLEADWACTWLNLDGQLVESTVASFEEALSEALSMGTRKIVLLMIGVSHTDAAGVAAIDRAKGLARNRGIRLTVRASRRSRRSRRPLLLGLGDRS